MQTYASNSRSGETSPGAYKWYGRAGITKRLIMVVTFVFFGFSFYFAINTSNILETMLTILIIIAIIITSVAGGYTNGYRQISVYHTGAFVTAINYIDDCGIYAKENDLIFKDEIEARQYKDIAEIKNELRAEMQEVFKEEIKPYIDESKEVS